ncbi:hypothetical protein C8R43DRAFT_1132233 [Mycena crocata]|nr:hypothetical protein C8R43DRAFT_1132233 [Mycena crocata]
MSPPGFKVPTWKELHQIEADVRAIVPPACTKCAAQQSQYRCWKCPVEDRFCEKCMLAQHAKLPLHEIEERDRCHDDLVVGTVVVIKVVRWEEEVALLVEEHRRAMACINIEYSLKDAPAEGLHVVMLDYIKRQNFTPVENNSSSLYTDRTNYIRYRRTVFLTMAKKRKLLGSEKERNKRARGPDPDRSTEIAARRFDEQQEIARSTAEMSAMWESEEWNTAMDAVLKEVSPGPPLFSDFLAKNLGASDVLAKDDTCLRLICHRDLGYDDEASDGEAEDLEQHWSQRPIICHRSLDSEPVLREWANLNMLARTSREMGPGQRRSILDDRIQHDAYMWHALEKGRPARPPSNKRAAKFALYEEYRTSGTTPLEDNLDSELMRHLATRAHILRFKMCQARGVRENEHAKKQLCAQNARFQYRLDHLV